MNDPARYADLHLHTSQSDGSDRPAKVVERAARTKLSAIAIADHDTTSGLEEARRAAAENGLELLSAVEVSTVHQRVEVHVLAYGIHEDDVALQAALAELRANRERRAGAMIERLEELGVPVSRERLAEVAGGGAIGRLHVARVLYEQGVTKTVQEGFDRFIGQGRPAYVAKANLPLVEALDLIHGAGGVAVIAHPGLNASLRKILNQLLLLPFDGIEVYHVQHSPGESSAFLEMAREHGLLVTGGSDCHGNIKGRGAEMGKVRLGWEHYLRLKERIAKG